MPKKYLLLVVLMISVFFSYGCMIDDANDIQDESHDSIIQNDQTDNQDIVNNNQNNYEGNDSSTEIDLKCHFTEDDICSINDLDEFEKLIILSFKNGDHELLNLLIGENRYESLEPDPNISIPMDDFDELNIQIGSSGYLYSQKIVNSIIHFNILGNSESIAYYIDKSADRFYLKSFGTYIEPNTVYFDVDNYISFPGTKEIPYTLDLESFYSYRNYERIAELIKIAVLNDDWLSLARIGGGYIESTEGAGVVALIPQFKLEKEIASIEYEFLDGVGYRYYVSYEDGTNDAFSVGIYEERNQTKIMILY